MDGKKFEIRFLFDAGSGICFWAANDSAREEYGYAIEPDSLPFSENLWREAVYLCAWWDTSIDWDDPARGSLWSYEKQEAFFSKARSFLVKVRAELSNEYRIIDESKIYASF